VARLKKDGGESKIKELPDLRVLQNDPQTKEKWVLYSARDAVTTWWVYEKLKHALSIMAWHVTGVTLPPIAGKAPNMFHFYERYLKDFGELLTDMERNGIKVDTTGHLRQAEIAARAERNRLETMFVEWAAEFCPDIQYINIASSAQMQQLLFGEYEDFNLTARARVFKIEKTEEEFAEETRLVLAANPYANHTAAEIKVLLKERGLPANAGKKDDCISLLMKYDAEHAELSALPWPVLVEKCKEVGLDEDALEPTEEGAGRSTSRREEVVALYMKLRAALLHKETIRLKREAKKEATATAAAAAALLLQFEGTADAKADPPDASSKNEKTDDSNSNSNSAGDATNAIAGKVNLTMPKRFRDITITTIGLTPTDFTPTGQPQVSSAVLKKLAGRNLLGGAGEGVLCCVVLCVHF
jgi:hypothetical protein